MSKRRVLFKWRNRELTAIGEGSGADVVVKSIERRLKNVTGVTLWPGNGATHFVARYFDGVRYHEDDVFLV